MRHRFLVYMPLAVFMAGCGGHRYATFSDPSSGLSFRYPKTWAVSGFSRSNDPRRLVVASYSVKLADVEGDCGGAAALGRIPPDGAAVLLIDYGRGQNFPPHANHFKLSQFRRASYDCFGESYMLRFRRGGHDLQAHVALGPQARTSRTAEPVAILDSIKVHS